MERVEHKVGEIFEFNDVKLQVFEHGDVFSCNECYFRGNCDKQLCLRSERKDGKSVMFKLIH